MLGWLEGQAFRCHCWRRQPKSLEDHIGVTAWVLVAFSRLKHEPSRAEIEFLLNNQHSDGWRPQFPSTDQEENASTFPTAMSVCALHELSKRALIPHQTNGACRTAIHMGTARLVRPHT